MNSYIRLTQSTLHIELLSVSEVPGSWIQNCAPDNISSPLMNSVHTSLHHMACSTILKLQRFTW